MWKWLLKVPPRVGSKWTYRSFDLRNPFEEMESFTVVVLDVADGFVQYELPFDITTSLSVRNFRSVYRELAP